MLWVSGFVRTEFGVRERHLDRLHDDQYGNMEHDFKGNYTPNQPNDWSIIPEAAGIFFPAPWRLTKPVWEDGKPAGNSVPDAALPARPWWRASGVVKPVRLSAIPSRGRRRAFVEDCTVEGAPTKHQPEGASKRFSRAPATPRHHRPALLSWLELLDRGSNGQGRWPFAVGRHA